MRKLIFLFMIVCFVPMAFGQGSIGGTIPFVYDLDVTFNLAAASALGGVDATDYDNGGIAIPGFISAGEIQANDSCSVSVSMSSWTLPANYPASGPKQDVTSNSDLHLRITGIDGSDDVALYNSFGTYQELTSSNQICLMAKSSMGVATGDFGADAFVDLAWGVDPTGAYSVTVTLTVAQEP